MNLRVIFIIFVFSKRFKNVCRKYNNIFLLSKNYPNNVRFDVISTAKISLNIKIIKIIFKKRKSEKYTNFNLHKDNSVAR